MIQRHKQSSARKPEWRCDTYKWWRKLSRIDQIQFKTSAPHCHNEKSDNDFGPTMPNDWCSHWEKKEPSVCSK